MKLKPCLLRRLSSHSRERGVTLIELMIGMVIALLIAAAIGSLYIGSKESFRVADNANAGRESGMAIADLLTQEVRKAGNYGCFRWKEGAGINLLVTARMPVALGLKKFPIPYTTDPSGELVPNLGRDYDIRGGDIAGLTLPPTSGVTRILGTDYVAIAYGQPVAYANETLPTTDSPVILANPMKVESGEPLLLADCDAMQLFRSDTTGPSVTTILKAAGLDNTAPPDNVFGGVALKRGAVLMRLASTTLFLGSSLGKTSLYSWDTISGDIQPFAENVIKMRALFAVDNGGTVAWQTGPVVTANAWWNKVQGVRLHFVVQGIEATGSVQPKDFVWDATRREYLPSPTIAAPGNRIQQAYTVTSAVRGRVEVF